MKRTLTIALITILVPGLAFALVPSYDSLGSISEQLTGPTRLAVGPDGSLYVTDPLKHTVNVYSSNGSLTGQILDVKKPIGIACDSGGQVYVGDSFSGSVKIYDPGLSFVSSFAESELGVPVDIETPGDGNIYVVDAGNHLFHIYDISTLSLIGSFGSAFLHKPEAIVVDLGTSQIFVSNKGGRIDIFDLSGNHTGAFSGAGTSGMMGPKSGNNPAPGGMAVDSQRIYIAEALYGAVAVFNKAGGFLGYIGDFGKDEGLLKIPLDVVIDNNNRMLVTDYGNRRISIFGLESSYVDWNIDPFVIDLTVYENGSIVSQDVSISANSARNFTVSSDKSWISVSPASGTTDSIVTLSVSPADLASDDTAQLSITDTGNGTVNIVQVNASVVKDYSMAVTPSTLHFTYLMGSGPLPGQTVNIVAGESNYTWNAAASDSWIVLDRVSGNTSTELAFTISPDISVMDIGTHAGSVVISTGVPVNGSPATVNVIVDVVRKAGTLRIESNIPEASYSVTGPVSTSGSGVLTELDLPQGKYEIAFNTVPGYTTPTSQTVQVKDGDLTIVQGTYIARGISGSVAAISAGSGADTVSIMDIISESQSGSFSIPAGDSEIISGDVNGDGTDEIMILNGSSIVIYDNAGTILGNINVSGSVVGMASGDINGDGTDDIIIAKAHKSDVVIKVFNMKNGLAQGSIRSVRADVSGAVDITTGDFDGNGNIDLAIADSNSVEVLDLSERKVRSISSFMHNSFSMPKISSGDVDGNGTYEIIVSKITASGHNIITIYNADGSFSSSQISFTGFLGTSDVSAGDTDGDGTDEVVVGDRSGSTIKVFDGSGNELGSMDALIGSGGVKIAVGGF
ncbi:MAG: hypothetical protein JSV21_02010 [Nitrospirota bacterium]|nr:MAG: hypothetical protein JSV21_02010 [Nitrospirota bacterium]